METTEKNIYRNIFCANCGEKGHIVKECPQPITSFGIIVFKVVNCPREERFDKNVYLTKISKSTESQEYPKLKYLMIQRKDTMGYIDFVRAKYTEEDRYSKIAIFVSEMTAKEKETLLKTPFEKIWSQLWVNHNSKCFRNEYARAKEQFEKLDLKKVIDTVETNYTFNEFGFPKGRRNMKETNLACAEREFCEETGYSSCNYNYLRDYGTVTELFKGTNGICYRHNYYIAKMKRTAPPPSVDYLNKDQIAEVSNIGWFTFEECKFLLRPYDTAKKEVLEKVNSDLLKFNFKFHLVRNYRNRASR